MRNALLLILLVGIGVAVYRVIKHRKPSVDPKPAPKPGPEPAPKPLGPGDILKPGPSVSPVPDHVVCKYTWEDQCASNCKKYFRIANPGLDGCKDQTGTYYKKDQEVKCHFFDNKILGTWITKAKASGHFFMITIAISEVKCNVLEATCSYFNGDEGGVLTESMSLNTGDSSVVYVKDPKTQITYTLPSQVQRQMVESNPKFRSPIGNDIVLDWAPGGYWTCTGLAMKDDTNFGTFKKGGLVTDAPTVAKTYTNVVSPLTAQADQDVEITLSGNEATVTVISDDDTKTRTSATAPFVYSGLTSNDVQLIKMDQKMRGLLRKITTKKQNIAAFNAGLLEMTKNAKVVLRNKRTNAKTTLRPPQLVWGHFGSTGFDESPPLDASGSIDASGYPFWQTNGDRVKYSKEWELFSNSPGIKVQFDCFGACANPGTITRHQMQNVVVRIDTASQVFKDLEANVKNKQWYFVPDTGVVPLFLTDNSSFRVGSRPTFDLFAKTPDGGSLRFMPA